MKKTFYPFLLAGLVAACQQQQKPVVVTTAVPAPSTNEELPTKLLVADNAIAPVDSLSSEMLAMLRQYDLSKLYVSPREPQNSTMTLDGFCVKEPERVSIALLKVVRDTLKPNYFSVIGKLRYKKVVSDFNGFIQVNRLSDFYDQRSLLTVMDSTSDTLTAHAYSAYAYFKFKSTSKPTGYELTGRALLDFWVSSQGKLDDLHSPCEGCENEDAPSKGSGLLLKGSWFSQASNTIKPFMVSRDVFIIANRRIKDFGIGDRGQR